MKAKSFIFIVVFLISLSVIPFYNSIINGPVSLLEKREDAKSELFNIDQVMSFAGAVGNVLGISSDAEKVFFGKDKWLFLGEGYNHSVSKKIDGPEGYEKQIQNTIAAMDGWNKLTKASGARGFYILIGPDKDSIYTDKLPQWYVKSESTISQKLIEGSDFYVNTPSLLINAKKETSHPLYFKTDTHWNELGAYVAFKGLISKSKMNGDDIVWPNDTMKFIETSYRTGDLARFQRSSYGLNDANVDISSPSVTDIPISIKSFNNGTVIYSGLNKKIEPPKEPLLVSSPKALNKMKVLWIRDSFGTSMSRVMAYTFSETLQLHHARLSPNIIKNMMESYKPDYVIITVVERNELSGMFSQSP